jgi:hypothetical protein
VELGRTNNETTIRRDKGEEVMAYIDKVTHMQRVAFISKGNGNIEIEGVIVEGTLLAFRDNYKGGRKEIVIMELSTDEFDQNNPYTFADSEDLILVFKDKYEKSWCPREHSEEYDTIQGRIKEQE